MASPRPILGAVLAALVLTATFLVPASLRAQGPDPDMDKLMAPIALYPDALLAQVLTAATSPDHVTKFQEWMGQQQTTGSDLQQAAMDAGFDAAFASLALFCDVIKMLADNIEWTKEIGTAYLSSKDKVMASVQRLRAQAQAQGNLKSNEQQTVTVTHDGGSQTIIIEPTNPQVVYVPVYNPQVVYVQSAPPSSDDEAAAAALLAFGLGVAIGAAIDNDYYGWGAWGWGWHGGGVYYHRSVWVVPVRPRYPYNRPVPGYRPRTGVATPHYTNSNINRNRASTGNRVNPGTTATSRDRAGAGTPGAGGSGTRATAGNLGSSEARGRPSASTSNLNGRTPSGGGATQYGGGGNRSAYGGYSSGSSTRAASSRGRSSMGASRGGGGGRRR